MRDRGRRATHRDMPSHGLGRTREDPPGCRNRSRSHAYRSAAAHAACETRVWLLTRASANLSAKKQHGRGVRWPRSKHNTRCRLFTNCGLTMPCCCPCCHVGHHANGGPALRAATATVSASRGVTPASSARRGAASAAAVMTASVKGTENRMGDDAVSGGAELFRGVATDCCENTSRQ